MSTVSTSRACPAHHSRSPLPWLPLVAPTRSAARSAATRGSRHPISGENLTVLASWPSPEGLNTCTGPRRARSPPVSDTRSVRVEVASTAPGASRIRQASSPDFPVRGPPSRRVTSSTGDHTPSHPTRATRVANSVAGARSRRHRGLGYPDVAHRGAAGGVAKRRVVGQVPGNGNGDLTSHGGQSLQVMCAGVRVYGLARPGGGGAFCLRPEWAPRAAPEARCQERRQRMLAEWSASGAVRRTAKMLCRRP